MDVVRFYDTNALLDCLEDIKNENMFFVSSISLTEIENIKTNIHKSEEVKYKARQVGRYLKDNQDKYSVEMCFNSDYEKLKQLNLPATNDNLIVLGAKNALQRCGDLVFVTNDVYCGLIARHLFGLNVEFPSDESKFTDYKGWKEVTMSDYDMGVFYQCMTNKWELLNNQYLAIKNADGEVVDRLKWTDKDGFKKVRYRTIKSKQMGDIKPRNIQQEFLFDMLQDDTRIKVTTGLMGSGKDYAMLAHAISYIERGKYDKLIYVRNNIEVKNSKQIGFLPGDANEKLMPFAQLIADHVGGQFCLEFLIREGKIELQHLGFIRGRDIKNAIIYCSEAENMTKEHIQLLLGRVGDGSCIYLNGDFKQVDDKVFESNNGLNRLIDKFKGNEEFGYVQLVKTERSKIAEMADLLD